MTMTGRERVLAAINHEEPDRVPIVIGASNATGLKAGPYRDLKRLLDVTSQDRYIYDWPELGTVLPDEVVLERLHSDVRGVFDRFPAATIARNAARPARSPFIDDWGSGQVEVEDGTWYPGVHPLAEATTIDAIERYPWPDMDDPSRVAHVHAQAAALAADGRYAILATPWLLFPFERAFAMQGLETFLMNLALEQELAAALLWRIEECCKKLMGHFLDELGDDVDMIKIGDDLGTEQSLLMSPAMYRRVLKPVHADYISFIKSRTRAKVFFHTDGDVFDLLDDLVEIGVDILNPVQSGSGKLGNLAEVKRRYGSSLAFCGAIDTQHVLPHGTPAEVRAEVRRAIATLGPGGGYLLSAVHTVMNEVPAENVLAMVDAVLEFGSYPLASL
jgi:uroporphyrinogen decarboxylase